MNRCPVCHARFCAEPTCRRCGADLTLLMRTAARAAMLRYDAIDALTAGDFTAARKMLDTAQAIRQSETHRYWAKIVEILKILDG